MPSIDEAAMQERRARRSLGAAAAALGMPEDFDDGALSPVQRRAQRSNGTSTTTANTNTTSNSLLTASPQKAPAAQTNLLDLDDLFGGGSSAGGASSLGTAPTSTSTGGSLDVLADIFSAQPPAPPQQSAVTPVMDLFGAAVAAPPVTAAAAPSFVALEKGGLRYVTLPLQHLCNCCTCNCFL
jgi:hypothetical protein